ncbi:MAG: hypothetical protein AB7G12_17450 [Thermoanaerobaculia bacterium]
MARSLATIPQPSGSRPAWRSNANRAALGTALLLVAPPVAAQWQSECATQPSAPAIARAVAPTPLPGKWRGRGFGDRERFDIEVEECGHKLTGAAGVEWKKGVIEFVPLVRSDDGSYHGTFTYKKGKMPLVITWTVDVESERHMEGMMTIMGRPDGITFDLLEAKPYVEGPGCDCRALKDRRAQVAARSEAGLDGLWQTDPRTCAVAAGDPRAGSGDFPSQASFEVAARAARAGELVRRERCCAVQKTGGAAGAAAFSTWLADGTHAAGLDAEADRAELAGLDSWIRDHCAEE